MPQLTPDSLFEYAIAFTEERIQQRAGRLLPTFREASRKFRCKISDIQDAIDDYQGRGYLNSVVGLQCAGGTSGYKHKGDFLIETERA